MDIKEKTNKVATNGITVIDDKTSIKHIKHTENKQHEQTGSNK